MPKRETNGRRKQDNQSFIKKELTTLVMIISIIGGIATLYFTVVRPTMNVRDACAQDVKDLRQECDKKIEKKADKEAVVILQQDVKEVLHTLHRWEGRDEANRANGK